MEVLCAGCKRTTPGAEAHDLQTGEKRGLEPQMLVCPYCGFVGWLEESGVLRVATEGEVATLNDTGRIGMARASRWVRRELGLDPDEYGSRDWGEIVEGMMQAAREEAA